ncbi:UDP-N-acetylmuramoyl-L-alanyl-D-glutamate--2,6-diaminopimelate ligase [candidate division WOR-3 bacterium]|nr:UDP-N-acetylmuramoyl-L-alanyl-D-glutamate--2,6-diaminopimelate ligase [candidate division WOR-3 bacterium]
MKTLKDIRLRFPSIEIVGEKSENIQVGGIGPDSRTIEKGDVFAALDGKSSSGREWAKIAIEKGASAILSDKLVELDLPVAQILSKQPEKAAMEIADFIYDDPVKTLVITGVTGTNGKTTLSFMLRSMFHGAGLNSGMIGTTGHYFPDEKEKAYNTTPQALEIARLLGKMKNKKTTHVVVEVSSHALSMGRTKYMKLDAVVFSSFGHDHLDWHGDLRSYFNAKLGIFSLMKKKSFSCVSESVGRKDEITKSTDKPVYFYSMEKKADFWADQIYSDFKGSCFFLRGEGADFQIKLNIPGAINILNAVGASACAVKLGIDHQSIKAGLESVKTIPGRMQKIKSRAPFGVFVDFAHTPDAMENLLLSFRRLKPAKLITVFGCGGERDRLKRPIMGKIAETYSDTVILTDDNPRREDAEKIIEEIILGMNKKPLVIRNRKEAIREAINKAVENSVVVICGKGHEICQIVGVTEFRFDDSEEARAALEEAGWK